MRSLHCTQRRPGADIKGKLRSVLHDFNQASETTDKHLIRSSIACDVVATIILYRVLGRQQRGRGGVNQQQRDPM